MASFLADLQYRVERKGLDKDDRYDILKRVRVRCSELLLRMYAEDSGIILMNDTDHWWVRKIVWFVHNVILKDQRSAG